MKLREEFPDVPDLAEKVDAKLCPEITAYYKRLRRLSEKLFLNKFNYFVKQTVRKEYLFLENHNGLFKALRSSVINKFSAPSAP